MLFSRMVARRMPKARDSPRKIVIASTATGIEADTVMPTLRNRYRDEAPKTIPRSEPITTAGQVSSRSSALSGTYGWKAGVPTSPGSRIDSAAAAVVGAVMSLIAPSSRVPHEHPSPSSRRIARCRRPGHPRLLATLSSRDRGEALGDVAEHVDHPSTGSHLEAQPARI